jgi:D-erythrulose 1-phosphate 3-epimerase
MLGVNLCFAVKRMPEPRRWAAVVRDRLGLDTVQFTFDLLDPWWPPRERSTLARRVVAAAREAELTIDSCFVGLAHYVPSGLLDPDPDARAIAKTWWRQAIDLTAALGASALGGPLGTMSTADAADDVTRGLRQAALAETVAELAELARAAGVGELLIEPTPIRREYPATIDDCQRLLRELSQHGVDNVGLTLDTGHMLFQPLHGADARIEDWISHLGPRVRQIHLDNTDGRGDPHWGWPHPAGRVDVGALARCLHDTGLSHIPVMLEVYPRFEDDSAAVEELMVSSVRHCRAQLATPAHAEEGTRAGAR